MKTPERVVWKEGMFMSPQHLQQQDAYHEDLLDVRIQALSSQQWGVIELDVSAAALAAGEFELSRFVGVMPGGLVLSFERGHALAPASRPIESHLGTQRTLGVYLAVPKPRARAADYAAEAGGQVRYVVGERTVADLGDADSEIPVTFARPNVRVLFEPEPRDDLEVLKIAELTRDSSNAIVLCDPYIPPCLRISASPFLTDSLRRVLELMVAQRRSLADKRREPVPGRIEFNPADMGLFLRLNALSGAIPVLQYMLDTGDASVREAYLLLVRMAGQLSALAVGVDPADLPKLQFTDLRSTFEPLFARLMSLLHTTEPDRFEAIALERAEAGYLKGNLADAQLARGTRYFLAVQASFPAQQVTGEIERLAKVASPADIGNLVRSATSGVPLKVAHRPPSEIPVRRGVLYFELASKHDLWNRIVAARELAVYVPHNYGPDAAGFELLAVPPS